MLGPSVLRGAIYTFLKRDFTVLVPCALILLMLSMGIIFFNVIPVILSTIIVCITIIWTFGLMNIVGYEINFLSL